MRALGWYLAKKRYHLTRKHHGEVVGPGQQPVLLPPPLGDERDVEAQEECDVARVGSDVLVEVLHVALELALPAGREGEPVRQVDGIVK